MNVAASSTAPVQPSASIVPLAAWDDSTPGSFATTMQAVKANDETQDRPATAQPKAAPSAADTPAASFGAGTKAIPTSTRATSKTQATSDTYLLSTLSDGAIDPASASDELPTSGNVKGVLSSVAARDNPAVREDVPKPGASCDRASVPAAWQQGSESPEAAAGILPSVSTATSAVADALDDKKLHGGKEGAAGISRPAKKSTHVHEAGAGTTTAGQALQSAGVQTPLQVNGETAAAPAARQQAARADEPGSSGTTDAVAALTPTAVASSSPHAGHSPDGLEVTAPGSGGATAPQPIDAIVAPSARRAAAVLTGAAQALAVDDRAETLSAKDVFAGALGSSAAALQPAATFVPSLTTQAAPAEEHRASDPMPGSHASTVAGSVSDEARVQAAPVRRLEIAVDDPLLGVMDVRAEMRGGMLHATLTGAQENAAASLPALHQFLQQHDVSVHTLTYATAGDGVAATSSTSSGSNDMGRDSAGRHLTGGGDTGSQPSQGNGSQAQQQRRYGSATGYDDSSFAPAHVPPSAGNTPGTVAHSTLSTGRALSIHI